MEARAGHTLHERLAHIQSLATLHYPEAQIRPIGGLTDVEVVIQIKVRGKAQVERALAALGQLSDGPIS